MYAKATDEGKRQWWKSALPPQPGVVSTPAGGDSGQTTPATTPGVAPVELASETTSAPPVTPVVAPSATAPPGVSQAMYDRATDEGKRRWQESVAPVGVPQTMWSRATKEGQDAWRKQSTGIYDAAPQVTDKLAPVGVPQEMWDRSDKVARQAWINKPLTNIDTQSLNEIIADFQRDIDSFNIKQRVFNDQWAGKVTADGFVGTDSEYQRYIRGTELLNAENAKLAATKNRIDATSDVFATKYAREQADFEISNVKLGDGSYMAKSDFDDLKKINPDYAKIVQGKGYDALIAQMNTDAGIVPPPSQAAIKKSQQDYFASKGWDISDKTNPNYTRRIMEATRALSDNIGYTSSQAEINAETNKERWATAKESVMQIVPFEYLRSGRWNELQLWEKIVYPITDVVSIVPVVGWAGKGVAGIAKGVSTGAKVAALGGRAAVDTALKDATAGLEKGVVNLTAKRALVVATEDALKTAGADTRVILTNALKASQTDAKLAAKEVAMMQQNVANLQKLTAAAAKTSGAGALAYKSGTKVAGFGATKYATGADIVDRILTPGAITAVTIANWKDMTPAQRATALALAALASGVVAPTIKATQNVGENLLNPYKIPSAGIKARKSLGGRLTPGSIWSEGGGASGGTTRLVIDETLPPEKAREAMATIMQELHEGKRVGTATYGSSEIEIPGTGFQEVVGGNVSFSATPMGDIFKEGTGAFGKKTRLEQYLTEVNQGLPEAQRINIETRPYNVKNLETGELVPTTMKTVTTAGVTVAGKEGGQYVGQTLYTKFAHQAAYGAKGNVEAGLIIHDAGIDKLPKAIAEKRVGAMEKAAIAHFDGTDDVGKIVEGFKRYRKFMEAENVITNGTQEMRVNNLRSKLADKLRLNKGEYFTRDGQGRIELFQMYIEGGRTTPYTLKELYKLKGNALRNALEDMVFGLREKVKALKAGRVKSPRELDVVTKEEQISDAFSKLDDAGTARRLASDEVLDAKRLVVDQLRRSNVPPTRARVYATLVAGRTLRLRDADYEGVQPERGGVAAKRTEILSAQERGGRIDQSQRQIDTARSADSRTDGRTSDARLSAAGASDARLSEIRATDERSAGTRLPDSRTITTRTPDNRAPNNRLINRAAVRSTTTTPVRTTDERSDTPRIDSLVRTDSLEQPRYTSRIRTPVVVQSTSDATVRTSVPAGSIAWQQGFIYKYLPPPFKDSKPISLRQPPIGFVGSGTPASTIQIIGRSNSRVPKVATIDLGWADIIIKNGSDIQFGGKGLHTNVGTRIDSATTGMSVIDGDDGNLISGAPTTSKRLGSNRAAPVKKATKRKMSSEDRWYKSMTTLGGTRV